MGGLVETWFTVDGVSVVGAEERQTILRAR